MVSGREQFVDGLGILKDHEGEPPRHASIGVHLDGDALDLAEFAKVLFELGLGGIARETAHEELPLIVLTRDTSSGLLLFLASLLLLLTGGVAAHFCVFLTLGLIVLIRHAYFVCPVQI